MEKNLLCCCICEHPQQSQRTIGPHFLQYCATLKELCFCCWWFFRNAAAHLVKQELLFVGGESGKRLAMRDIIRKVRPVSSCTNCPSSLVPPPSRLLFLRYHLLAVRKHLAMRDIIRKIHPFSPLPTSLFLRPSYERHHQEGTSSFLLHQLPLINGTPHPPSPSSLGITCYLSSEHLAMREIIRKVNPFSPLPTSLFLRYHMLDVRWIPCHERHYQEDSSFFFYATILSYWDFCC